MSSSSHPNALQFIPPSTQEIGALLPAYEFDRLLAKGGMGAVYHATQKSLDRSVAIKILPREFGEDPNFRDSFETEAKLMARFHHPNLISIFDFGSTDGMLFIVMEFVAGKSLHENAHGRKLDPAKAADIILGICDGLQHAHEAGILHRDIKPANIFITTDGKPKIGDFGLARPSGNTETGIIYGTPGYTAPEVLHAPANVGAHTDVYSVGVILYELLAGKLPDALYEAVTNFNPCDPAFDNIIRRALHPTPALRYQSAKQMADDLRALLQQNQRPQSTTRPLATPSQALNTAAPNLKIGTIPPIGPRGPLASSRHTVSVKLPTKNHSAGTIRNIVIIIILLAAIYFLTEKLSKKKQAEQEANTTEQTTAAKPKPTAPKPATPKPSVPVPTPTQPNKPNISAFEAVSNIKGSLLSGERPADKMPSSAFTLGKNSRTAVYIDKPMTWFDADTWCQNHGGYLATSNSPTDINTLRQHIPDGKTAWLGAGTASPTSWSWIDSSTVDDNSLKIHPTAKLGFALADQYMNAKPMPGNHLSGFFIEWKMDGSNPAALETRLLKAAKTLKEVNPSYPAGTATYASRHYLFINIPLSLHKAKQLAARVGASIAIPSDAAEMEFINSLVSQHLPKNVSCRIGGFCQNNVWKWISNEKWVVANWENGYPKRETSTVIISSPKAFWQDVSPDQHIPFTLLEWSNDANKNQSSASEQTEIGDAPSFDKLKAMAKNLVHTTTNDHHEQLRLGNQRLIDNLESYFKGLNNSQRFEYGDDIEKILDKLQRKSSIPNNLRFKYLNDRGINMIQSAINKQADAEKEYDLQITKIRQSYEKKLRELIAKLKAQGQLTLLRSVENELRSIGRDNKSFLKHFR